LVRKYFCSSTLEKAAHQSSLATFPACAAAEVAAAEVAAAELTPVAAEVALPVVVVAEVPLPLEQPATPNSPNADEPLIAKNERLDRLLVMKASKGGARR
jgi:hypothetical protein